MYGPIGLEIKNILRYFVVAIVVGKASKMASIAYKLFPMNNKTSYVLFMSLCKKICADSLHIRGNYYAVKNEEIFTISHDREVLPISGIFIKELYRCDFKFLKKKRRGTITIYCITRTV